MLKVLIFLPDWIRVYDRYRDENNNIKDNVNFVNGVYTTPARHKHRLMLTKFLLFQMTMMMAFNTVDLQKNATI